MAVKRKFCISRLVKTQVMDYPPSLRLTFRCCPWNNEIGRHPAIEKPAAILVRFGDWPVESA